MATAKRKRRSPSLYIPPEFVAWLNNNYIVNSEESVPKDSIYRRYVMHCREMEVVPKKSNIFGKMLKKMFPNIRPRRLGSAGNMVAHYAGITLRQPGRPILASPGGASSKLRRPIKPAPISHSSGDSSCQSPFSLSPSPASSPDCSPTQPGYTSTSSPPGCLSPAPGSPRTTACAGGSESQSGAAASAAFFAPAALYPGPDSDPDTSAGVGSASAHAGQRNGSFGFFSSPLSTAQVGHYSGSARTFGYSSPHHHNFLASLGVTPGGLTGECDSPMLGGFMSELEGEMFRMHHHHATRIEEEEEEHRIVEEEEEVEDDDEDFLPMPLSALSSKKAPSHATFPHHNNNNNNNNNHTHQQHEYCQPGLSTMMILHDDVDKDAAGHLRDAGSESMCSLVDPDKMLGCLNTGDMDGVLEGDASQPSGVSGCVQGATGGASASGQGSTHNNGNSDSHAESLAPAGDVAPMAGIEVTLAGGGGEVVGVNPFAVGGVAGAEEDMSGLLDELVNDSLHGIGSTPDAHLMPQQSRGMPFETLESQAYRMRDLKKFLCIFVRQLYIYAPIQTSVLDERNLEYYILYDGKHEHSVRSLCMKFALYMGALYCESFQYAKEFYQATRDTLSFVFDELNLDVSIILMHMSQTTNYWYEKEESDALAFNYISAALSLCQAAKQMNSEIYRKCVEYEGWLALRTGPPGQPPVRPYHPPPQTYKVIGTLDLSRDDNPLFENKDVLDDTISILTHVMSTLKFLDFYAKPSAAAGNKDDGQVQRMKADLSNLQRQLETCYNTICIAENNGGFSFEMAFRPKFWLISIVAAVHLALGERDKALQAAHLAQRSLEKWLTLAGTLWGCGMMFEYIVKVLDDTNDLTTLDFFVSLIAKQKCAEAKYVQAFVKKWQSRLAERTSAAK